MELKFPLKYILCIYYLASSFLIIYNEISTLLLILQIIFQTLLICSHYQTATTQPGPIIINKPPLVAMREMNYHQQELITKNTNQLNNKCNICEIWKPPKAHHCKQCNVCIHYRDHHCQWLDCCIGYKNLKFFCQFLVYLSIMTATQGLTLLFWVMEILQYCHKSLCFMNLRLPTGSELALGLLLYRWIHLEIVFVGTTLTYQLLIDKCDQIPDLDTYNEKKMGKFGYHRNLSDKISLLFGSNPILWVLPLQNRIRLSYLELTYPKVTSGKGLLDHYLYKQDEDFNFYKLYQVK